MNSLNKTVIRKATVTAAVGALLLGTALSNVAQADHSKRRPAAKHFTEYARVIKARPVYKHVQIHEPRRQCWIEHERHITGYERVPSNQRYNSARANNHAAALSSVGLSAVLLATSSRMAAVKAHVLEPPSQVPSSARPLAMKPTAACATIGAIKAIADTSGTNHGRFTRLAPSNVANA